MSEAGDKVDASVFNEGPGYTWRQTLKDVEILVPLKPGTRARNITVSFHSKKIKVSFKTPDQEPIFEGELFNKIVVDECTWSIDDSILMINLEKFSQIEWWECVIIGHPKIDVAKIEPENSSLKDLDPETRGMVEKMMFDQRQRMMDLPDSEALKKQEALEKFKKAHPEMDFSNAKIN